MMSKLRQIVVLEVVYEPLDDPLLVPKDEAKNWFWSEMCGESVQVIAAGPALDVYEDQHAEGCRDHGHDGDCFPETG